MTTTVSRPCSRSFDEIVALAADQMASDDLWRSDLIRARKRAGLTQHDVAEVMGVSQATVSAFERHDNDPRLSTLRRYAVAVGVTVTHDVPQPGWSEHAFDLYPSFMEVTIAPLQHFVFAEASPVEYNLSMAHAADSNRDDFTTAA